MSPYISAALAALVAGYGGFLAGHWIGFGRGMKEVDVSPLLWTVRETRREVPPTTRRAGDR